MYNTVEILRRERAFKGYIETYNVEVVDKIGLIDLLFSAKSSIVIYLKIYYKKKRFLKTFYQQKSH